MARVPVAEGVFTWPSDEPRLIGSRCSGVRDRHVPGAGLVSALRVDRDGAAAAAPAGPAVGVDDPGVPAALAALQRDPRATRSCPYGVGYVELAGEVKVETRLTEPERAADRHGDGARARAVPHRRRRQRGRHLRVPAVGERAERGADDGRRDRRSRAASVRPLRGRVGDRDGRDRDPPRARGRGRRVARHPVRVRRELRGRQPRRGRRAAWDSRESPSTTSTTAARPRRARSRWPPTRSGSASTTSASPSAWTSTSRARSAPTRACTRARRGTASSATSSPRSSSG